MKRLSAPILLASVGLISGVMSFPAARLAPQLQLPSEVGNVRLGMSAVELLRVRPSAAENASVDGYSELLTQSQPFVGRAEYRFRSRGFLFGRKLSEIYLARSWLVDGDPMEINRLIPGLLFGAWHLWGDPTSVGVRVLPLTEVPANQYGFVAIVWRIDDSVIIVSYPPITTIRRAIEESNHAVPLAIEIWIGTDSAAQKRLAQSPIDESPRSLEGLFTVLPTVAPSGPVFH